MVFFYFSSFILTSTTLRRRGYPIILCIAPSYIFLDFTTLRCRRDPSILVLPLGCGLLVRAVCTIPVEDAVERLQAQLRDLKGKSSNNPSTSNTLDPLNQKLESKIVELEFQVVNYEREISHLKTTYKNLFDSIKSNRAHAKLYDLVCKNAQLRARGFKNTYESMNNTSGTSVTPHVDKPKLSAVTPQFKKLHASMPSHSVPQPREFNVVKHRNVIALGMFKINPSQMPR
nr:hypothetical protein [Tanacetum cinerariifolium]